MTNDLKGILRGQRPLAHLDHPREMIRQFTPNWFAATMGTGILALALPQIPGMGHILTPVGEALWFFNIALFALFTVLYTARWLMFGHEARRIFGHNTVSMFIGTIPMGLATIINGCLAFGIARFGDAIVPVAHVLWWIDVAMSLACGVLIPYFMFTRHQHSLDAMTAVWLLPVVAAEVGGERRPARAASRRSAGAANRSGHIVRAVGIFGAGRLRNPRNPDPADGAAQAAS